MMTPRTNPDLIPGAPWWANFAIKFGAFGVLAFLLWQNNQQTSETALTLVNASTGTVNRMPEIASQMTAVATEIRNDNKQNAEYMRTHTSVATASRKEMDLKLAAIDIGLASVKQELASLRVEQQKTYQLFLQAVERIIGDDVKNELAPLPPSSDGGA